ncbi:hypothetical protein NQ317_003278 [Molorchus minor]|uniref:Uncharacterized protein n=1 Tax=Molorchus minor TaxID=1323400 RepID=A0ABQ9JKN6_9CUCU|nr:hypothetical protein NQ317_003278 [Molorchus minor]
MQNLQEVLPMNSARLGVVDKSAVEAMTSGSSAGGEIVKKIRFSHPRDIECRVPRVTSDRDQTTPLYPSDSEKEFQSSIIADKYQLFEQVEGSSLYRCLDINTQEELVCKIFPETERESAMDCLDILCTYFERVGVA